MRAKRKVIYTFILFLTATCATTDQYELKLDLSSEKGNTYSCNVYHTSSSSFLEQSRSDTLSMKMQLIIHPNAAEENKVDIVFESIKRSIRIPKRMIAFIDSRKRIKSTSSFNLQATDDSVFASVIGKRLTIIVSNKGTVETVNGMEELISSVAKASHQETRLVKMILNDYVSENAVKDQFNRIFSAVPNKKVKVSDNWASDFTLIAKAPVHVNSFYTLQQVKGDSAYVNIQSKLLAGTAGNFYLNGTQSGLVIFNHRSGLPYLFESFIKTTTTTSHYDVEESEHWLIVLNKLKPQ